VQLELLADQLHPALQEPVAAGLLELAGHDEDLPVTIAPHEGAIRMLVGPFQRGSWPPAASQTSKAQTVQEAKTRRLFSKNSFFSVTRSRTLVEERPVRGRATRPPRASSVVQTQSRRKSRKSRSGTGFGDRSEAALLRSKDPPSRAGSPAFVRRDRADQPQRLGDHRVLPRLRCCRMSLPSGS
jgi:hypothetical protein